MTKKEKSAKMIRVIMVPPIPALLLLIILSFSEHTVFANRWELLASIFFLALIPLAAYPIAAVLPAYRAKGREGQRNLAFILSVAGYATAVVYGLAAQVSRGLLLIYLTYFFSVAVLIVFNKFFMLRASGHACSIAGPLISMVYFMGWKCILPCAMLFALTIWASLALKRHTLKELIAGSGSAVMAFAISLLFLSM